MLRVQWNNDENDSVQQQEQQPTVGGTHNSTKQPSMFKGVLHGRCVIVTDLSCYDRGFFGTGSYSRSRPVHDTYDQFIDDVLVRQNKLELKKQLEEYRVRNAHAIVQTPNEVLVFTLQEAFYLCFALGSMQIFLTEQDLLLSDDKNENNGDKGSSKCLTIRQAWIMFCELEGYEHFVSRYAAFHYYRSRGWVTRSGVKYGCDYVLYKRGPELDHAQYCVRLVVQHQQQSQPQLQQQSSSPSSASSSPTQQTQSELTWKELQHHCRLSVTVSKNLLLCVVTMNSTTLESNQSIEDFLRNNVSVTHLKLSRYQPEKDRDTH